MKTDARHIEVLDMILRDISDPEVIAQNLGVSVSTIRKDINALIQKGQVARGYKDALIALTLYPERLLQRRFRENYVQKQSIAVAAARHVQPGDTLIIDAGTTTGLFARMIRDIPDLTVITSGLAAVSMLVGVKNISLIVLGGSMRHGSHGMVGPMAELSLQRLTADKAFVSADGVVAGRGLCEASISQAWLKEQMIQRSREVYVLADSRKVGNEAGNAWTALSSRWTLITDMETTPEQLGPFMSGSSVRIVVAD